MPSIPLLAGIYANAVSDLVSSLPMNREIVVLDSGLGKGYLRPAPGIKARAVGPGIDRGAHTWNDLHYRVCGSKLIRVDSDWTVTVLGEVGFGGPVTMDHSFDRMSIASANKLFYWDGTALTQVTDVDLGVVDDAVFLAGYFLTTDGTSIVATELNDPTSVNPLKYGSAEVSPDAIVALAVLRDELLALGTSTIQFFNNVGGNGFPFANASSALIPRGCVGTFAWAYFHETIAFVGSAVNEMPGVYVAGGGTSSKISERTLDLALSALTADELAAVEVESRVEGNEQRLIVHLPAVSYVFYYEASKTFGAMWTRLASGRNFDLQYRGRHAVLAYGQWVVGDADGNIGTLDRSICTHFGDVAGWQFDTALLANPEARAIINVVELVGLFGEAPFGSRPVVFNSMTIDGRTWSQERPASPGGSGQRDKTVQWRNGRRIDAWAGLRFRGADDGMATYAALNVTLEALGG